MLKIPRLLSFFLIYFLLAYPSVSMAQLPITVTGVVLDGITNVPIANVRITNGQRTTTTAPDGRFSIEIETEMSEFLFEANGYLGQAIAFTETNVKIRLFPIGFTETVEVVSGLLESETLLSTPVTPETVFRAPGSIDNVFRTLDTLAGVASTDDFGSRLAVRGGTPDQNLTVMDGIEVHNPYRLFGIASAFNPETVGNFQFTAGGFGAEYGDRLSSLLIINNREGRQAFHGTASASVTDTNVVLEGSVPVGNDGNWLFSARRTYYDLIVGRLQNQNFPSFADLQLQIGWKLGPGHRFTLMGLRSVENTDLDIDFDRPNERAAFGSAAFNGLASARFDAVLGSLATATTTMSWYRNRETLDFDGLVTTNARRSNAMDDNIAFGLSKILFNRSISVLDISLRQKVSFQISPWHSVSTGFDLHLLTTSVELAINGDRNETVPNGSSVRGGIGLPGYLDSRLKGTRGGLWIQDIFTPSPGISFEPGLRLDWSTINSRATISPRVAASYAFGKRTRLRGAAGLYTQSPGYEKLIQSDYFIDLSSAHDLLHEKAVHVVFGIEQELWGNITARVEGYYKRFADLLIGRLETDAERLARISQYDFPASLQENIPSDQIIVSDPTNEAGGNAYGLDFFITNANSTTPLTGWISYAWGRANRESYGRRYAFEYDRSHAFNTVGQYQLTSRLDLAATIRLASGFPHTPPVGLRVAAVTDHLGRLVPATDTAGNLVYGVDYGNVKNINKSRLPHYARIDLRLTYQHGGATGPWSFYIEVINLLNRNNAVLLQPQLAYDQGAERPRLSEVPEGSFPRIPTVGLRVRF